MGSLPDLSPSSKNCNAHSIEEGELRQLFDSQRRHLDHFFQNLDISRTRAFAQILLDARGAVFFSGVGKSGFVARKLSQTLASLGFSRAAFLSPVDALHGDIGAVSSSDVVVLISKSGSSEEILKLVPCLRSKGAKLISLTSVEGNPLVDACDLNVHLPLERELCPFDLAPVTSAAVQMVFGDTVAVALMAAKNLKKEEYAANHPAGRIGKSLIFKV